MARETLPHLAEANILPLATSQSFSRGDRYYHEGAILNPMRQGLTLWAECQGSELYRTRVTLSKDGIAAANCTCAYHGDGICKHQVALLLTYVRQPDSFHVTPPLEELLASRSREELIALIGQMVQRVPDLLSLVELSTASSQGQPIDISVYRRQAQRALRRDDMEEIAEDLEVLRDTAQQLLDSGDWLNAGALYQMLLEETTESYDDVLQSVDYDGEVAGLSQDFAEGLGQCLAQAQNLEIATREIWLTTLLDAELKDVEIGGIDYAAGATDHLLEQATDAEWAAIEQRIREEIKHSSSWRRQALVGILAARHDVTGQGEEGNALIHELGTPEQRAFVLVEEGKLDEAVAIAQQHFTRLPGVMKQFADTLLQAKAPERALQLIEQAQTKNSHWGYQEWLVKYHQEYGDAETALEWQKQVFLASPSLGHYKTLKDLAQRVGDWQQLRSQVLRTLESSDRLGNLIEIALDEGDIERALELLDKMSAWSRATYVLNVAKAAEKKKPQEAIALYQQMVEQSIAQRNRSSYQVAAQHLKQVKVLYESLNAQLDWSDYINRVRLQYPTLRALQDELNKAKL